MMSNVQMLKQEEEDLQRALTLSLLETENERIPNSTMSKNNLYVKNLHKDIDDRKLKNLFAPYGTIVSAKVTRNESGQSRGFGFVCFSNEQEAKLAIPEMNGRLVGGKELYVSFHQSKEDRRALLTSVHSSGQQSKKNLEELDFQLATALSLSGSGNGQHGATRTKTSSSARNNLYVNNFGKNLTDEALKTMFQPFGTVLSAQVMKTEAGRSKGFGFVCYSSEQEAKEAIRVLNGKEFATKKLYVGFAQTKEERKAFLNSQQSGEARKKEENVCCVCLENPCGRVCFVPCGHTHCCKECADQIFETEESCPICRSDIERLIQIFL